MAVRDRAWEALQTVLRMEPLHRWKAVSEWVTKTINPNIDTSTTGGRQMYGNGARIGTVDCARYVNTQE